MNLALKIQLILTDITTLKINVYCWYIRLGEASIGGKILKEVIDESFELLLEGDVDICSIMWTGVEVVYGLAGSEKEISTLKKANKGNVDSRGLLSDFLEKPVAKECGRFYSITNEAGGQVFVSTENIIQSDIAKVVSITKGKINIISGRHGDWMDNIRLEPEFYTNDVA